MGSLNNSLCLWVTWPSMYDLNITLPRFNQILNYAIGKLSPIVCVKYFGYTKIWEDVSSKISATDSASLDCRGKAKLNFIHDQLHARSICIPHLEDASCQSNQPKSICTVYIVCQLQLASYN